MLVTYATRFTQNVQFNKGQNSIKFKKNKNYFLPKFIVGLLKEKGSRGRWQEKLYTDRLPELYLQIEPWKDSQNKLDFLLRL